MLSFRPEKKNYRHSRNKKQRYRAIGNFVLQYKHKRFRDLTKSEGFSLKLTPYDDVHNDTLTNHLLSIIYFL